MINLISQKITLISTDKKARANPIKLKILSNYRTIDLSVITFTVYR